MVGFPQSPFWSYQLGYRNGFIPTDPRTAAGKCDSVGNDFSHFTGAYELGGPAQGPL